MRATPLRRSELMTPFLLVTTLALAAGCGGEDEAGSTEGVGASAGAGGAAGTAGNAGDAGSGGTGGTAGSAGDAGSGGSAGTAGSGGSAGSAGAAGNAGSAGSGGGNTSQGCPAIPSNAIWVSDGTELASALDAATGGETIALEDGDYGTVEINDKTFSDHVTVIAENPRKAVFLKIGFDNSHYLRVCGVTTTGGQSGVLIEGGSTYIEILNSEFYGAGAMFDRNNPDYTQVTQLYGLRADGGSSHLLIENNYAHDIKSSAFVFFGVSDIVVRGNNADWLQSDGYKFGGVTNALVENNTGMQHVYSSPDAHVDFMQAQGAMSDSVFRGNVALMNTRSFQGLFFGDATFSNILFDQNVIYTGHTRGISADCASCTATNNTVLAAEKDGTFVVHKQVTIHGIGTQENNVTSTYLSNSGLQGTNHALQYEDPNGEFFYNDYYENAKAGPGLTIEDLRPVAGSPADGQVGAYARINALLP